MVRKIISKLMRLVKHVFKALYYYRLHIKRPTIIANNCSAVFLYKKFGCKYYSPTINLQLSPLDYIKFCKNLKYYLSLRIDEVKKPNGKAFEALGGNQIDFPIGRLDDLIIYFQHYKDFKSAEAKWEERKARINYSNMFFILIDTYCDVETVKDFFTIPYKNKIFLTGNNELLLNENCILISNDNQKWYEGDWINRFQFKKWFLNRELI